MAVLDSRPAEFPLYFRVP